MIRRINLRAALVCVALGGALASGSGCAAENANTAPVAVLPADSDPVALLPRGAIAVVSLDARAFYTSGAVGAQLAMLSEKLVPLGQEAGFSASRDVDRILIGVYAAGGIDGTAVLTGRFDPPRIEAALEARLINRGGAFIEVPYGGHMLFTSNGVSVCALTQHTVLAGSDAGVRRVLDRLAFLRDAHPQREIADWMVQTLDSPGAAFGVALDFSGMPPGLFSSLPLPMTWTTGLVTTRIIGNFHDPGMNVAGTLAYADPQHAASGADSLRQLGGMIAAASAIGVAPRIQNLTVVANGTSVESKFVVDEQAMKSAMGTFVQWLGGGRPAQGVQPVAPPPAAAPAHP